MAGAHGATTSSLFQAAASATPIPGKSTVLVSSLSSPFPSRRSRRANHLRQKILKTLENKPYLDSSLPEFPPRTPVISVEESVQEQPAEVDQVSLSATTGFVDGIVGKFSTRSFIKIGLYLVGAFVFQTICAVLIFGSNDLDGEDENLNSYKKTRVSDLGVNGSNQRTSGSNSLVSGNRNLMETIEGGMVLVDESEMDKRIVEIQEMAREARQREKLEAKEKGLVEGGSDDVDYDFIGKTMKEKEVDGRITKLRKSLESNYEKLPPKISRKEGNASRDVDKGILAAGEAFGPLMFKKNYKYRSPSIDSVDRPMGFNGIQDRYAANGTLVNGITDNNETLQMGKKNDDETLSNGVSSDNGVDILDNGDGFETNVMTSQDENKEQGPMEESMPISKPRNKSVNRRAKANTRAAKTESIAGTQKDARYDKEAVRAVKSGKSNNLETRKPRGFGKEGQSDAAMSNKNDDFNRKNGPVRGKKGGSRRPARNLGDMKSSTEADFWWTSLPYVLGVLMQRGGDDEGSEGLFTLRSTLQTKSGLSHTVAFEDCGDATNVCCLLESFFEDLGDFRTDIIPIPTNELVEAVKSQIMNVFVVKKGQLQLYAGQPLADVEAVLRTLIEQNGEL